MKLPSPLLTLLPALTSACITAHVYQNNCALSNDILSAQVFDNNIQVCNGGKTIPGASDDTTFCIDGCQDGYSFCVTGNNREATVQSPNGYRATIGAAKREAGTYTCGYVLFRFLKSRCEFCANGFIERRMSLRLRGRSLRLAILMDTGTAICFRIVICAITERRARLE